jgi:hypothetical protein
MSQTMDLPVELGNLELTLLTARLTQPPLPLSNFLSTYPFSHFYTYKMNVLNTFKNGSTLIVLMFLKDFYNSDTWKAKFLDRHKYFVNHNKSGFLTRPYISFKMGLH